MNDWMNARMNEWMNERTNERMHGWMDGCMDERTNERMNEWTKWLEWNCMHACRKQGRGREGGRREGGREGGRRMAWMNKLTEWDGLQLNGKQLNLADMSFFREIWWCLAKNMDRPLACPKVAPEKSSQEGSCHLAMDALKSNWRVTIECNRPTSPARYEDLWSRFWSRVPICSHMFPWFGMTKQVKNK